jgi:hypothetical protein
MDLFFLVLTVSIAVPMGYLLRKIIFINMQDFWNCFDLFCIPNEVLLMKEKIGSIPAAFFYERV